MLLYRPRREGAVGDGALDRDLVFERKVYAAPLEARRCLEINCADHEAEEFGKDLGTETEKYSCIATAPCGGKIYAAPREAHFVLEVDPKRRFVREVGTDLGRCERKFSSIIPGLAYL